MFLQLAPCLLLLACSDIPLPALCSSRELPRIAANVNRAQADYRYMVDDSPLSIGWATDPC